VTGTLYASLPELKQYLAIGDAANDVDLERALDAASRKIDGECGRTFGLQTAQTRLYYPESAWSVRTPDLVAVTTLKTDPDGDQTFDTTLTVADYELWPLNEGRYQEIRIRPQADDSFTPGRYVQVVGTFGVVVDGGLPVEVRQAALILASRYYKRAEAPFGVLQNTDLGQYTRLSTNDPDVVALLSPWRLAGGSWVVV
jgi:hypothetical protein